MDIILKRIHHTRWGVDGKLFIDGEHIADTTEHPTLYLKPGIYPITLPLPFKRGNGPMLNTDGSICVGRAACAGCVLNSEETFFPLYNRIRKSLQRKNIVQLIITDSL